MTERTDEHVLSDDTSTDSTSESVKIIDLTQEIPERGIPNVARKVRGTHDQETRKLLAQIILGLIAVLYTGIIGFFLFGGIDSDQLTDAVAAMSGPQALAAAAIGFYYGSKHG